MRRLLNVEQALHLLFERDVAEGNADPESEPESEEFDDEGNDPSFVLKEERGKGACDERTEWHPEVRTEEGTT
ncbi:hypothetical protein ABVT39_023991 [Epinephelus coioides]